ncbi:hypothetical protein [Chryseobacterium gwangjuense]|uniref:hypothetical protein n=1 Tax=Chryseobacterium gwangjuense TaxID=1069980 RepID=UPI001E3DC455|nr:hypothetical protein [Chryseobacterium gwangjuense]MCE3074262.1 hypothetical protein [Chryseobacterium gwangjuense]
MNCNTKTSKEENNNVAEIFRTNYGKINDKKLRLKFGDLIELKIQDKTIRAIVLDIQQENTDNWFGLCFLNNNQLFGRRIPQGFDGDCIDLLDFTFINEKGLKTYKILKSIKIDFEKVGFGSDSPAINENEILRDYKEGIEKRKQKETPCEKKISKLDPVNECYFPITKIE